MTRKRLLTLTLLVSLTITSALITWPVKAALDAPLNWLGDTLATLVPLTYDWDYDGDVSGDEVGYAVSTAGDVNGDGYADVIIGAPKDTYNTYKEGVAYLFHGSPAGLSGSAPNWTVGSNQQGSNFGSDVSTAGDVNGDGYDDIIVGASQFKDGQASYGAAFVFHGSAAGLSPNPDWSYVSEQRDTELGVSVSTAGDVNGDGYADIIVGARWYSNDETNEGRAFVFHGSQFGLNLTPAWTAEINQANAGFGSAVATTGDVNGDGYADVIVGAPEYDHGDGDEGAFYVFYGAGNGLNTTPDRITTGEQAGARLGAAVGPAGDINQDGYADIIVGAPMYDTDKEDTGAAFLFHGSAAGLRLNPQRRLDIGQSGSGYGVSAGTAGDVNGDDYDDVIVGANLYTNDNNTEGGAFLYLGSACGLSLTANWIGEGNKAETEFGFSVSTANDINRDGYADIIIGAPTYRIETDIRGRALVYHGVETDGPESVCQVFLPILVKGAS